jgi:putative transcriptional regulator
LVDYSANGAVGFILNKPFKAGIKELFVNFPDYNYDVFVGGPVNEDNLYYIHTLGNHIKGSIKVKDDLYWGGDFEQLKSIIDLGGVGANQIKFFLGYSGWSPGQLDSEIAEKSWLVAESDIQMIMNGSKDLWLESVKKAGDRYKTWKNFPKDPKLN